MKIWLVLIFVGVALLFCGKMSDKTIHVNRMFVSAQQCEGVEVCDGGQSYCPPLDQPDYDECCKYFKDSCCTHSENEKLKTM